MKIANHRLVNDDGSALPFVASPNNDGVLAPEFLVMHFTAGANAASSIAWLCNPLAKASAHLVIARDGAVTQLVAFNRRAWHAGKSNWAGRVGLNGYSIGIELDNHGELVGTRGNWKTSWGRPVRDEDAVELAHKHDGRLSAWHMYPEVQLTRALEVGQLLVKKYTLKDVVGHDDIAPGRKRDPGPAFPFASFQSALFGRADDAGEAVFETSTELEIRSGPGTQHDPLPGSPLDPGTPLVIERRASPWLLVTVLNDAHTVGWVHGRYVRPRYA